MKKSIILSVSIVVVLMLVAMIFTVDSTQTSKSENDIIKVTVYEVGTNKKLKRNPMASKYLTVRGKELKEAGEKAFKENFKKGRRHTSTES